VERELFLIVFTHPFWNPALASGLPDGSAPLGAPWSIDLQNKRIPPISARRNNLYNEEPLEWDQRFGRYSIVPLFSLEQSNIHSLLK
jgi:hypothetical protein